MEREFGRQIALGLSTEDTASTVGVSKAVGNPTPPSGRPTATPTWRHCSLPLWASCAPSRRRSSRGRSAVVTWPWCGRPRRLQHRRHERQRPSEQRDHPGTVASLLDALGLRLAELDFAVTRDDQWVFLSLRPDPDPAEFEDVTGYPVVSTLALALVAGVKGEAGL